MGHERLPLRRRCRGASDPARTQAGRRVARSYSIARPWRRRSVVEKCPLAGRRGLERNISPHSAENRPFATRLAPPRGRFSAYTGKNDQSLLSLSPNGRLSTDGRSSDRANGRDPMDCHPPVDGRRTAVRPTDDCPTDGRLVAQWDGCRPTNGRPRDDPWTWQDGIRIGRPAARASEAERSPCVQET